MALPVIGRFVQFPFSEKASLVLSDKTKIHCDPKTSTLRLKADVDGKYPLDSDLYARGPLVNPTGVRHWLGFQAHFLEPKVDLVAVGTVRFRLNDGTKDYWWDGSQWDDAPVAGEWNTHVEIQNRLPVFPVTARKIRVVFCLKTTDAKYTPVVYDYTLLHDAAVESFAEEVLLRSLVPALRDNVRPTVDVPYTWPGGSTLDLDSVPLTEPVEVKGVAAAFNLTDDPGKTNDLYSAYNPTTHVVTLSASVAAGKKVLLRLIYEPEVVVATHPDFNEIARLPAIIVESMDEKFRGWTPQLTSVVNEQTLVALSARAPRLLNWTVSLVFNARRLTELLRLTEKTQEYLTRNPLLSIKSLDTQVAVVVQTDPSMAPRGESAHVLEQSMVVSLKGVEKWFYESLPGYGVKTVEVGAGSDPNADDGLWHMKAKIT